MERLQKVIANHGHCSRRKAEELIATGHVTVNSEVVTKLGTTVGEKDHIEVDGVHLGNEQKVYVLLFKPRGTVTTVSDDKHRKTVVDLIETDKRIYPVGRLDYDTTGVLLLTNDGVLANLLMHPKSKIEKVYIAKVKGIVSGDSINKLKYGVVIDGKKTAPAKVKLRKVDKKNQTCFLEMTIHEGKNHQVKKMVEAVGHEVIKLTRERISILDLTGLKSGEYRYLNPKEVKKLYYEVDPLKKEVKEKH